MNSTRTWESLLPKSRGTLPNGNPMPRTDPSGSLDAKVFFLGAYPAATAIERVMVDGTAMMLPTAVETESFASGSKSGQELDSHYLKPLRLERRDVLITDMVPYFFANTTESGSGRSMADNIARYEKHANRSTGIETRPLPADLVKLARDLPGNLDRLGDYLRRCSPKLLFTLGAEAAAFVRSEDHDAVATRVDELFYAPPAALDVLGVRVEVVHMVHPHLFIKKNAKWMTRHRAWCDEAGSKLVRSIQG